MVRIQQLKLPISHTSQELEGKISKILRIPISDILSYEIVKQSIDARKKNEVSFVYTIDVVMAQEEMRLKQIKNPLVSQAKRISYKVVGSGTQTLSHAPVIIGSGPAGMFCGYLLAEQGYAPILIERGKKVEERQQDVALFWKEMVLNSESNVQFGEGGAGTFSDGKLNTLVKDVKGRNKKVLDVFIENGAPKEIAYHNKPHIGTDILLQVVSNMRKQIEAWGGTYLFQTCVTDFEFQGNDLKAVLCKNQQTGENIKVATQTAVLAIGHSARDTFELLLSKQFEMEAKSFAVGMRVEHPQAMISENQYGIEAAKKLPPASYKLATTLANARGVYSFCMCPGGYVVNASSQQGQLAVNGMSYHGRNGKNSNSAIIVTVTPKDYPNQGPLGGVAFQQQLEKKAYELGNGKVPQQLFGDYEQGKISQQYGTFETEIKGQHTFGALHELFSEEIRTSFIEGMHCFSHYIPNFNRADAILSGVESRTSSPVRITRDEFFESNKKGVYPCGEGAGYAGGIMSAAMDGLKVAEAIIMRYQPFGK